MTTIHIIDRYVAAPWMRSWTDCDIDTLLMTLLHQVEENRENQLMLVTDAISSLHQLYFQPQEDEEFDAILEFDRYSKVLGMADLELMWEAAVESPNQGIIIHLSTFDGAALFWEWLMDSRSLDVAAKCSIQFVHWHCVCDAYALKEREAFLISLPDDRHKKLVGQLSTVLVHAESDANELHVAPYKIGLPLLEDFTEWQAVQWSELRGILASKETRTRELRHRLRRQMGIVDQAIAAIERLEIWQPPVISQVA